MKKFFITSTTRSSSQSSGKIALALLLTFCLAATKKIELATTGHEICILDDAKLPTKSVDFSCSITVIKSTNFSGLSNNNTPLDCGDDTFTSDVIVTFDTPPGTGTLNLSGTTIISVPSVDVNQLSGGSHTFQVTLKADGNPINLTAFFSDMPGCKRYEPDAGENGQNAPHYFFTNIEASNFSGIDTHGTPACSDNTFDANVKVTFNNVPSSGLLILNGDATASVTVSSISGNSHTFPVTLPANNLPINLNARFTETTSCLFINYDAGQNGQDAPNGNGITGIVATNISAIDNKGTPACDDDTYTAKVKVDYNNPPSSGSLSLSGDATASVPVLQLSPSGGTHIFNVTMRANGTPIRLKAFYSIAPDCMLSVEDAGQNGQDAPLQCTDLCLGPPYSTGQTYPPCWPDELATGDCEKTINYAPDPDHPELTPIKYIKTIIHVFQKEDPNDPGNFTEAHLSDIKSFFDGQGGINDFYSHLCPASDDGSPDYTDARIRFLNTGTLNYDVFFHQNNNGWGTSFSTYEAPCPCTDCCNSSANQYCYKDLSLDDMVANYVTTDTKNAYHIFLTGGRWRDCDQDGIPDPAPEDGYNFTPGAFTSGVCAPDGMAPSTPAAAYYGLFNRYQQITNPTEIPKLGRGFGGEMLHVLGVDHPSPLQAHWLHANDDDGCDDTPWHSNSNLLDCNYSEDTGTKCALTKCQLGKIHYFFEKLNPSFQSFPSGAGPHIPVGEGAYTAEGSCDITMPDIIINSGPNVTWNFDRQLRSNVIVKLGGRLYIYCRVGMPSGAKITVEPGGRLYLFGEVYNNCDNKLWDGIVVKGDPDKPQSIGSTEQGFFRLLNGTIEGANTSIRVEPGGMVFANGGTIRNCGGMVYKPYPSNQVGWISGCDFTCDGSVYNFGGVSYNHAVLHAVNNVRFSGCDFSVTNVPAGMLSKTDGIKADDSRFSVNSNSTFRGFDTGINASGQFSATSAFTVNKCTFSNNQTGIFALSVQNFTVTNNTFEVGGPDFQTNNPCGLMMDECTGYTVEKNNFYSQNNTASGRFGIMTESSGGDANLIRDNKFDYLEYANLAQKQNRGPQQGLQYQCNDNGGHNTRDFYVPDDVLTSNAIDGIHINQGNGKAAMNTFSHLGALTDGDFRNEVGSIAYNYKSDPAHEPNPNAPLGTGGISKINVQDLNSCPSDVPPCDFPCTLSAADLQTIKNAFNTARDNWQTEKAALLLLLDGGDTDGLLAQINGATSLNAGQVRQRLLNLSPWLSVQALAAAINKKQVLTENTVVQILNANPEVLREATLRTLVKSSFSQAVANGMLANASTQTARTTKENLVGQYRATMLRKADLVIQDMVSDTIPVDVPQLRTWLANKQSLEADYAVVESYLSEGDFVTGTQKLNTIPQSYTLDAEGTTEHTYFANLATLWQDAYAIGKNMAELDQSGISKVQYIADNSTRRAGAMAQGIMNTWYGGHYRVVPILPSGSTQWMMAPPTGNGAATAANYLSMFPNPAKSSVFFQWNLPDGMENATISISDLQGRLLETIEITGQQGKQEWSVELLGRGIYLYHLRLPDGNTQTSKLVIIK